MDLLLRDEAGRAQDISEILNIIRNNDLDDEQEELGSKIRILIDFVQFNNNEDMKRCSLESLGSLISTYMVSTIEDTTQSVEFFNVWLNQIKQLSNENIEFTIRYSALKSLVAFDKINKDLTAEKLKALALLFSLLSDDDKEIRSFASQHLSLFLGVPLTMIPLETEKKMIAYFARVLPQAGAIDLLFEDEFGFMKHSSKQISFDQLFIEDLLLFTVEKQNFYRNDIVKAQQLSSLLLSIGNVAGLDKYLKHTKWQVHNIVSTLQDNEHAKGDGCFGWLMDEDKFTFVYCALINLITCCKLEMSHELVDELKDIKQVLGGSDIQPLISGLVAQL